MPPNFRRGMGLRRARDPAETAFKSGQQFQGMQPAGAGAVRSYAANRARKPREAGLELVWRTPCPPVSSDFSRYFVRLGRRSHKRSPIDKRLEAIFLSTC